MTELFDLTDDSWGYPGGEGRKIDASVVARDAEADWWVEHARKNGVDLLSLYNGRVGFVVVPTRGLGIQNAETSKFARIGWKSPAGGSPIHPSSVNLADLNGLGWLSGFNELMCRCGLESNGPPIDDPPFRHGLHGRIANQVAGDVEIFVDGEDGGEIGIEGWVPERRLFGPNLSLRVRYATRTNSNALSMRDTIMNHADSPTKVVLLYHWNFGPPILEAGAQFVAPHRAIVPQSPRAAEGIGHYGTYGPPQPGFAEQVYLYELLADAGDRTVVLLRSNAGDLGVALRFSIQQLPCFTLWKCERGLNEGYVTGLEPGTNYPNPRPFEREHGRFVELGPGEQYVAETTFEILEGSGEVGAVEAEIGRLQGRVTPRIEPAPIGPWAPE